MPGDYKPQSSESAIRGLLYISAIVFREEISKHKIPGRARRILDKVIRYSLERVERGKGEFKALIPTQSCFCLLCGLDKADVSRQIQWLRERKILIVEPWDHGRGGECWYLYSLAMPNQWDVGLRRNIGSTQTLRDLESWLLKVSIDQPELIEPPESLQDLLFENFVECSAPGGQRARVDRTECPVGETPTHARGPVGETPTHARGPVGETPTEPSFPIDRARARRSIDRSTNRIDKEVQIDRVIDRSSDFPAYVEERLFRLIGEHERNGRMAETWSAAISRMPERLNELIATVEAMQRERTIRTTAVRWLNASVRNEMAPRAERQRT